MRDPSTSSSRARRHPEGFSLIEMLVSVSIIIILMAMLFQFMGSTQKQYTIQQLQAEVSQGGRSAFEIMGQELNQAGYNPPFKRHRVLSADASPAGSSVVSLSLQYADGSTSGVTNRIYYGTRLIVGDACTGAPVICSQEEVLVNFDTSYSPITGITTTTVPAVLTNKHVEGEPVYTRNYPFPQGIIYDDRTDPTASPPTSPPAAVAVNKIRFFGDIMDTGELYYGEYRLQCPGAAPGTYIDACTTGCTTGPFTLTRIMTRLVNGNVFSVPTGIATVYDGAVVSPLMDNIQGTCSTAAAGKTAPNDWLVATVKDENSTSGTTNVYAAVDYNPIFTGGSATATYVLPVLSPDGTPAMWFKTVTYGGYDTTLIPPKPYFQTMVLDVYITLTVQQSASTATGGQVRTQRLQTHIVPRNITDALSVASNGGSALLPPIPIDPTHDCDTSTPKKCPTLPVGVLR